MKISLINGTDNPEQLVCTAARNDYRSDGVIATSFPELMAEVEAKDEHLEDAREEMERDELVVISELPGSDDPAVVEAQKRTLIDHLMDSGHWGPFEHPSATVAIEGVTRVAMAQITRHRHFTFDIMSLRYVEVDGSPRDVCAVPHLDDLEVSRDGVHDVNQVDQQFIAESYGASIDTYRELVENDIPREEARKVLPMGTKVNIVMSGNARAWMHLLNIRGKANVQGEARRIADCVMREMKLWMPYTFEKYDDMLPLKLNP